MTGKRKLQQEESEMSDQYVWLIQTNYEGGKKDYSYYLSGVAEEEADKAKKDPKAKSQRYIMIRSDLPLAAPSQQKEWTRFRLREGWTDWAEVED